MAQLASRLPSRLLRGLEDERLARLVEDGNAAAFEVLYDRHHRALLAFCRHMLGNREDGEDALQQTFVRAHKALDEGRRPDSVRPWLFAIARNRCRTMLAARAATTPASEWAEPSYDGLSADVRRRAELRQLVGDIARLPADQREALVLFELGGRSQTEIASVIGCAEAKVKALVFQARSALIAERDARDTPPAATSRLSSTALATKVAVTAALAGAGAGGGAALVDNPGGPAPAPGPPRVEQSVAKQATTGQAAASGELSVTRSGEAGELSTREPQPAIAEASATTPGVTGPAPADPEAARDPARARGPRQPGRAAAPSRPPADPARDPAPPRTNRADVSALAAKGPAATAPDGAAR